FVTYNEDTGGRISRPENINGNWSINGGGSFNIALDTLNRWDVSGSVNGNYNHHVSYVNLNHTEIPDRNVTHTYNVSPSLSLSFRNKWLSISLNGSTTYARTENKLQASNNLSTWNFSYGGNTKITFPWGTNLSTDAHMYSKRGYDDQTLNTNELIWNAQLSHSFLRGKKLTVMLQWYDILREQSNFSRTVNANGWTDREVNAITSYAMLHISYRLNLFGKGNNAERSWRERDGEGEEGRRGERGNRGGRGGGFGGGRGGGFRGGGGGF
ncbi:MAG: outer membrane beta-barrel family protein, partial [Prevotella sp.]|nr:outer membrane beta-barrel family protein [Prevotella sp.]